MNRVQLEFLIHEWANPGLFIDSAIMQLESNGISFDNRPSDIKELAIEMKNRFDRVHRIPSMDSIILIFATNEFNDTTTES